MTAQRTAETQLVGAIHNADPIAVSGFALDLNHCDFCKTRVLNTFSYILRNPDVLSEVISEAERIQKEQRDRMLAR